MIQEAITDAVIAALKAAGLTVGDGTGSGLPRPHVVVQTTPGRPYRTSLDRESDGRAVDVPLQLVGDVPRSIRWLAGRIETALLDVVLDVPGWTCAPAERPVSTAASPTNDLHPPAWASTDVYRVHSLRAKEPA